MKPRDTSKILFRFFVNLASWLMLNKQFYKQLCHFVCRCTWLTLNTLWDNRLDLIWSVINIIRQSCTNAEIEQLHARDLVDFAPRLVCRLVWIKHTISSSVISLLLRPDVTVYSKCLAGLLSCSHPADDKSAESYKLSKALMQVVSWTTAMKPAALNICILSDLSNELACLFEQMFFFDNNKCPGFCNDQKR